LQSQNDTLRQGNNEKLNAKYIEIENKLFVAERDIQSYVAQIEQERLKTKKLQQDFESMDTIMKQGATDKAAISESSMQSMMLKNQKLESKLKDLESAKKDNHELKVARDKQQAEFKALYEDKQRLYEEIMALKEQVSTARSETKEKLMVIQFVEKDKASLEQQLTQVKKDMAQLEVVRSDLNKKALVLEQKLETAEANLIHANTSASNDKQSLEKQLKEAQT